MNTEMRTKIRKSLTNEFETKVTGSESTLLNSFNLANITARGNVEDASSCCLFALSSFLDKLQKKLWH